MHNFAVYKTEGEPITVERKDGSVRIIVGAINNHLTFAIELGQVHDLINKLQAVADNEIERIKMERYLGDKYDNRD